MEHVRGSSKNLQLLSKLLLTAPFSTSAPEVREVPTSIEPNSTAMNELFIALGQKDFEDLKALAITNHVILRSFAPLQQALSALGNKPAAEWAASAVQLET